MSNNQEKNQENTALKFPCVFPVKIFGLANEEFQKAALGIIHKHFADVSEGALRERFSKDNKYLSLTVTVNAQSKAQLDDLYQELSACPEIIMAL